MPDDDTSSVARVDIDKLAKQLLDARARPATATQAANIGECFLCGRSYMRQPWSGDDNSTRFCSDRCREIYDTGKFPPASENPGLHPELMPNLYGHAGWRVVAGPPGLEVGSLYYEDLLDHCDRKRKTKAKTAKSPDLIRPQRACECCGGNIPNWTGVGKKRRRTRNNIRFCSKKCSKIGPSLSVTVPEATIPRSQLFGPSTPPLNLVGGYRWPDAPKLSSAPTLPEAIVADEKYPGMVRVRLLDGQLSDLLNPARARELAHLLGERGE
jgi:ribosomal protein L24E